MKSLNHYLYHLYLHNNEKHLKRYLYPNEFILAFPLYLKSPIELIIICLLSIKFVISPTNFTRLISKILYTFLILFFYNIIQLPLINYRKVFNYSFPASYNKFKTPPPYISYMKLVL